MLVGAIISNLPEIAVGICWTVVWFWLGGKFTRWRIGRRA